MQVTSKMIRLAAPDGEMPAFLARPPGEGRRPAVIVVMEAFGLNDHIKSVASRIAAEGYVAVAPDMYHREKSAVVGYDDIAAAIRLMGTLRDDAIVADLNAVLRHLRAQPFVDADHIAITGFCMGGRISFLAACAIPDIAAAAPFYGGGIGGLLDRAESIRCPLLLFFGAQDSLIPPDEVKKIDAALQKLGKQAEVVVYDGAQHGFFCAERPSHHAQAAGDSWRRLLAFLAVHLQS